MGLGVAKPKPVRARTSASRPTVAPPAPPLCQAVAARSALERVRVRVRVKGQGQG